MLISVINVIELRIFPRTSVYTYYVLINDIALVIPLNNMKLWK